MKQLLSLLALLVSFTMGTVAQNSKNMLIEAESFTDRGGWALDQHFPTPKNSFFFPGEEFILNMKH
jgi:hypothetical protein